MIFIDFRQNAKVVLMNLLNNGFFSTFNTDEARKLFQLLNETQ